ncbi:hypothetical protein DSAG12_01352 [Promethearchaeum syntrophicum]|uniref:Histidine kinase N-terminal 7TM region domain-containing protein n=1 Tax=Promethearchaeum syntrophicum TaxID=2594042 RepID=A0A5B9DAC0_9ARCH|nr:hypothetical protein [Candidatus Prometheoarchaeum syntrophicum]QEE15526.1 hypothetical protein DSAG12_01352 [Candidatus Prometheoarchaeum syntrophicum]
MLAELTYTFEIITIIASFYSTYRILKKKSNLLCSNLMAVATGFIGLYVLFVFLYDIIQTLWSIEIFLRIAMMSILIATLFMFYSMNCMVSSSAWFQNKKKWVPYIIVIFGYTIYLIFAHLVTVESYNPLNISIELPPLIIMVIMMLHYLVASLSKLFRFGIKKTEGFSQKKMKIFATGLMLSVISIFINIFSQIFSGSNAGEILDVIFFFSLACSVVVIAFGFLLEPKKEAE